MDEAVAAQMTGSGTDCGRGPKQALAITPAQYRAFQEAYDFFNAELFAGSLLWLPKTPSELKMQRF
jgi:hypothetical protein